MFLTYTVIEATMQFNYNIKFNLKNQMCNFFLRESVETHLCKV